MKKKFAALLALWMMLCTAGAMAACGFTNTVTVDATLTAGQYRLDGDVTGDLTIDGEVTLCLHGNTLNGYIEINEDAHLTLEDCRGNGMVKRPYGSIVRNDGTFTMNGGTVEANNTGVNNKGTFTMTGGKVKSKDSTGVDNRGTFEMSGGALVTSYDHGVDNTGTFAMNGGTVTSTKECGVDNDGTFTMNGGTVISMDRFGVLNRDIDCRFEMNGGEVKGDNAGVANERGKGEIAISEGRISGKIAVAYTDNEDGAQPFPEAEAEKNFILPGSYKADGAFGGEMVLVKRIAAAAGAAADLPKTDDPSMLGAWVALLGASAAGMKLIRRKK